MKQFLKKGVSVLEAAALTIGLGGCAPEAGQKAVSEPETFATEMESGQDAAALEKDAAIRHLLEVWSDYLQVMDQMYGSELWAFTYVDRFLNSGEWPDLARARTACIASARLLDGLAMSKEDLSKEEYRVLFEAGIDSEYQSSVFQEVSGSVAQVHTTVRRGMLESLEGDVFFTDSIELMKKRLASGRASAQNMCRYICNMTNYLLLSLGEEAVAREYWEAMPQFYPTLCMEEPVWTDDLQEAMTAADKTLDELERLNAELANRLSDAALSLNRLNEAIKNEDMEALYAMAFTLKNTPDLLPMPYWYSPESAKYMNYQVQEDESLKQPESGEDLSDASYGVYCKAEGIDAEPITAEDINLYVASVKKLAKDAWKDAEEEKWIVQMPDYSLEITLEEGTATLLFYGADVTFAPSWYLERK